MTDGSNGQIAHGARGHRAQGHKSLSQSVQRKYRQYRARDAGRHIYRLR